MEQTWFSPRPQSSTSDREAIDYEMEDNRLESFRNKWSHNASLSPLELAAAGLYFTGPGDRVQCAWCKGGLYNWEAGDIAINEHKKHFPMCVFIQTKIDEMSDIGSKAEKDPTDDTSQRTKGWEISPAVTIVGQMGYNEETIAKGVQKVLKDWCQHLTASKLLDAIYEIEAAEEEGNSQQIAAGSEEGVTNTSCETEKLCDGIQNKVYIGKGDYKNNAKLNVQISDSQHIGDYSDEEIILSDEPENSENHNDISSSSQRACEESSDFVMPKQNTTTTLRHVEDDQKIQTQPTMNTEIVTLLQENKKLRHSKTCKICLENEVNILFLPCRHLVCCDLCGDSVKTCPLCRTVIVATVKTYLA